MKCGLNLHYFNLELTRLKSENQKKCFPVNVFIWNAIRILIILLKEATESLIFLTNKIIQMACLKD